MQDIFSCCCHQTFFITYNTNTVYMNIIPYQHHVTSRRIHCFLYHCRQYLSRPTPRFHCHPHDSSRMPKIATEGFKIQDARYRPYTYPGKNQSRKRERKKNTVENKHLQSNFSLITPRKTKIRLYYKIKSTKRGI